MTVDELIKKLGKFHGDAEVEVSIDASELNSDLDVRYYSDDVQEITGPESGKRVNGMSHVLISMIKTDQSIMKD